MSEEFKFTTEDLKWLKYVDPEWRTLCCSVYVYKIPYEMPPADVSETRGFCCYKCGRRWWNLSSNAYFKPKPADWDDAINALTIMAI
jgi:hypothetical protein